MSNPIEHGQTIHSLTYSYTEGMASLSIVPDLLKRVLEDKRWISFIVASTGQRAGFKSFEEFVVTPIPNGMGTTIDEVRQVCRRRVDVLALIVSQFSILNTFGICRITPASSLFTVINSI